MKTRTGERHSPPRWSWLRLSPRAAVRLFALLVSFPGAVCLGSSLQSHEDVEEQSTATTEIPFELYNDNLIIVKATIGPIKNVKMILDTGTSPTAITQEIADRLK